MVYLFWQQNSWISISNRSHCPAPSPHNYLTPYRQKNDTVAICRTIQYRNDRWQHNQFHRCVMSTGVVSWDQFTWQQQTRPNALTDRSKDCERDRMVANIADTLLHNQLLCLTNQSRTNASQSQSRTGSGGGQSEQNRLKS